MTSTELKPIIFYDIPCTTPGRPWSPNNMKTRYCLGYKGLAFTTVWVELPDIAGLLRTKGVTQPPYTLPAIEDPNTGAVIVDSIMIAAYLDETYPETPKVLSPVACGLVKEVEDVFSFGSRPGTNTSVNIGTGEDPTPRLVFVVLGADRLNPVSRAWYHQTRMAPLGKRWTTISDACSAGPEERAERVRQGIEAIKGIWRKITAMYDRDGNTELVEGKPGGSFVLGEEPCFLDFVVAGRIKYLLDGLAPTEVETVVNLEGGRLMRLVENLERYFIY